MILVLIADDEPLECEALEKMIYNRFPQVQVLPSVYDGLMLVDAVAREHPDIVIIDINMPGLNGLEALERLNMMRVQMEVIIHTAYSQFDYIHKALKMGASDFLVKPVFEEDFAEAFSSVLQTAEEKKSLSEEKNSDLAVSKAINSVLENSVMMSLLLHKPDENSWDLLWNGTDRKQEGAGLIAAFRFRFRKPDESAYDILVKAVRKYCNCLSMIHQNVCYCYLLANALMEAGTFQEWIKSWLPGLLNSMEDRFEAEAKVGISSFQDSYFDMYKAVDEADIYRSAKRNNGQDYIL